jgi:hypothetical protein
MQASVRTARNLQPIYPPGVARKDGVEFLASEAEADEHVDVNGDGEFKAGAFEGGRGARGGDRWEEGRGVDGKVRGEEDAFDAEAVEDGLDEDLCRVA